MTQTAAVILNGGQSSRMGTDKSQLQLHGKPLIYMAHQLLQKAGIFDIYVSANFERIESSENNHNYKYIKDINLNRGPLSGIQASLIHLKQYHHIVFIPVDMPLISSAMITHLLQYKLAEANYFEANHFPLLIQNNNNIRLLIKNHIQQNQLAIHQFLDAINAKSIKNIFPDQQFLNANTPEQWQEIQLLS